MLYIIAWVLVIIGGVALFLYIGELIRNKYPQSWFADMWRNHISDVDPDEM
jgi:hypothetical protein